MCFVWECLTSVCCDTIKKERISKMILIKKYLLSLLNLMIVVSLCFMNYSRASAQAQTQTFEEEVSPPLFSKLTWNDVGNVQKIVHVFGQTMTLNGNMFKSSENLQNVTSEDIFEYYSSENLQTLGWTFVGGTDVDLVYKHSLGMYLTVLVEKCANSDRYYCVTVWQSTGFSDSILASNMFVPNLVAFNKTSPANGSLIDSPSTTYQLLKWSDAQLASSDRYQYCIDETNNLSCDSNNWITRNSLYSGNGEFVLVNGHTYYWQVRTRDAEVPANGGTWWSFTVKALFPLVTSIVRDIPSSSNTNASSVSYKVTFDKDVTGVDVSDFTLTTTGSIAGASVGAVGGSGKTYTVLVNTGTSSGTIRLNLTDNDTIKDSQSNPLGGTGSGNGNFTTGEVYTIDRTPPTVSSVVVLNSAASDIVTFRATFSESVTGVDSGDFSVTTTSGTLSGLSVTSVIGSGSVYTVSTYVGTGTSGASGTFRLDVIDNDTIKDAITNPLGGTGAGNGNFITGSVFTIWSGGVSVTSDKNIVTVARPHIGSEIASYGGDSAGSLSAYVPMLFKDAFGGSYDSALYIQNTDSSNTANITIKFYDSAGVLSCTKNDTIPALGSKGYWLPTEVCLTAGWVGGVSITSDQPISALGRPHIGTEVMTYNGFSSGSLSSSIPMLFKDAFGGSYDAALYVQNLSTTTTANITIKFYDSAGALTCTKIDMVAALASKGYWLPSDVCLPAGWSGGAVITSDQPIVTVGRPHIGSQITTYGGFSSGSLSSSIPMLFKDAFGGSYDAALYVQNL